MNKPTHEEIAELAHRFWQESGPAGGDATQNWLDAERELSSSAGNSSVSPTRTPHAPGPTLGESHSAQAIAERATQQKKEAREPKFPTHTGPKSSPPESGKPLWNQPHSS